MDKLKLSTRTKRTINTLEQLRRSHAEGMCNLHYIFQTQVTLTTFDPSDVRPVQLGLFCKPFLGPPEGASALSNGLAQTQLRIVGQQLMFVG